MKNKRFISLMLVCALVATLISACGGASQTTAAATTSIAGTTAKPGGTTAAVTTGTKGTIEIAAIITSLTGSLAANGEYMTNGINMALEEINAAGGIKGQMLKVTFLDDQVKSSEAINAVKKAVDEMKVPVIMGSDSSGLVLASMPYAADKGIPQIVSGTNVRITNQGVKTIFRMRASDAVAAKILADYTIKQGYKKIAFMYTNEDYGKGFMQETTDNLKKAGVTPVATETCNVGDTDFTAQILNIKKADPDIILLLGKEVETAKFLRQSRELGVKAPFYGGSPLGLDYVVDLANKANMEGLRIVTHFLPSDSDPVVQAFVKKYMEKFKKEPSTHSVCYYDATKIIAEVMNKYGTTKEEIAKGLKELNYTGVQSKFKGSESGDLVTKQVIGEFKDGKWIVVDRIE